MSEQTSSLSVSIHSTPGGPEVKATLSFGKAMAWDILSVLKSQKKNDTLTYINTL